MQKIALPKKITFQQGDDENQGEMIVEPCYPGYGITIGNSIRRVLLSSLPGAAPVGIKIKGVEHEFMTLPHLKEDILEFVLNLKSLRLKVFSEGIVKLKLEVHGKKEIKAKDIKKDANVEVLNPELVLGHITDMGGSLDAEISVSQGMGYVTIESRETKEKELGYIEMDSIFSPVISSGVKLENVRVGKMTNWEKLILSIKTDGTMTPEQAFNQSVQILLEQFSSLLNLKDETKENSEKENEKINVKASDDEEKDKEEMADAEKAKKKRGRPKKTDK